MKEISFFKGSEAFYQELAECLGEWSVLEVYAGNGLLARKLTDRGVSIKATSLLSGHDGHGYGMHLEVEERSVRDAIQRYGEQSDALLVSWPVADESIMAVLELWSSEKPIFYIGEMPTPELPGLAGLPGCACDEFFERTDVIHTFDSYPSSNMLEKAVVLKIRKES